MNRRFFLLSVFVAGLSMTTSCKTTVSMRSPNHTPPGQMKKAAGTQSAKPFAPGQQKKKEPK